MCPKPQASRSYTSPLVSKFESVAPSGAETAIAGRKSRKSGLTPAAGAGFGKQLDAGQSAHDAIGRSTMRARHPGEFVDGNRAVGENVGNAEFGGDVHALGDPVASHHL